MTAARSPEATWWPDQVVVVSGHMVDQPGRTSPRFPASAEAAVTKAVRATLGAWDVGPGSLLISGGARGADIIGAEQALDLGAEVWLLIALPDDEFIAASVALAHSDWERRYRDLRRRCPTRFQADELGPPRPDDDVFARNNEWCLAVARDRAPAGRLRTLVVWDGVSGDGPGGTADFVERAGQLRADVVVIDPRGGDLGDDQA
jgi:hypothetical protein